MPALTLCTDENLQLLVIDDDPGDVELVRRQIRAIPDWETDVREVTRETELHAELERRPDVALVDFNLGWANGLDVASELRGQADPPVVIMMTGQGNERVAVEAIRAGVADYLVKSDLNPMVLENSLRSALSRFGIERSLLERGKQMRDDDRELRRRLSKLEGFHRTFGDDVAGVLAAVHELISRVVDDGRPLDASSRRLLERARAGCRAASNEVADLGGFIHHLGHPETISHESVPLESAFRAAVRRNSPLIHDNDMTVKIRSDPGLRPGLADESCLGHVIDRIIPCLTDRWMRINVRLRNTRRRGVDCVEASLSTQDRLLELACDEPAHQIRSTLVVCRALMTIMGGGLTVVRDPHGRHAATLWLPADTDTPTAAELRARRISAGNPR